MKRLLATAILLLVAAPALAQTGTSPTALMEMFHYDTRVMGPIRVTAPNYDGLTTVSVVLNNVSALQEGAYSIRISQEGTSITRWSWSEPTQVMVWRAPQVLVNPPPVLMDEGTSTMLTWVAHIPWHAAVSLSWADQRTTHPATAYYAIDRVGNWYPAWRHLKTLSARWLGYTDTWDLVPGFPYIYRISVLNDQGTTLTQIQTPPVTPITRTLVPLNAGD
ncbi:MAG: hypothetical protein ABIJ57_09675 [Pseudomonadota bacterium]